MKPLPRAWFAGSASELAPKLLGKIVKKGSCMGIIVETEAYGTDAASHAYHVTKRSAPMRDTYGHWYVYFTYGMHWCANVTTNKGGIGAVLIRAVEPLEGLGTMGHRRNTQDVHNLCSGPAKFCQAFGITGKDNNRPLDDSFGIFEPEKSHDKKGMIYHTFLSEEQIGVSGRIGITTGTALPWRFYIKDNPFVSGGSSRPSGRRRRG